MLSRTDYNLLDCNGTGALCEFNSNFNELSVILHLCNVEAHVYRRKWRVACVVKSAPPCGQASNGQGMQTLSSGEHEQYSRFHSEHGNVCGFSSMDRLTYYPKKPQSPFVSELNLTIAMLSLIQLTCRPVTFSVHIGVFQVLPISSSHWHELSWHLSASSQPSYRCPQASAAAHGWFVMR